MFAHDSKIIMIKIIMALIQRNYHVTDLKLHNLNVNVETIDEDLNIQNTY